VLVVAVVVLSGGGGVNGLPLDSPATVFRNQLPFFHKDGWKPGHLFKKNAKVEPRFPQSPNPSNLTPRPQPLRVSAPNNPLGVLFFFITLEPRVE